MGANNNGKTQEVLNRVHEFLSNLCRDARCDDHCSECLGASDLADDVYDLIHAPPRNCDVGTDEEQYARFVAMCHANVDLTGRCRELCPFRRVPAQYKGDRAECYAKWAQMPYERGDDDGNT